MEKRYREVKLLLTAFDCLKCMNCRSCSPTDVTNKFIRSVKIDVNVIMKPSKRLNHITINKLQCVIGLTLLTNAVIITFHLCSYPMQLFLQFAVSFYSIVAKQRLSNNIPKFALVPVNRSIG